MELTMNLSRLIFRSWYYFRIGYGTYVAFPLGFASTMIVIYELAFKDVAVIHDYFPRLYIFGIVALLVIGPISIYAGLYHIKRTGAYSAEASVLTESNPYVYRAIPGKEREVFLPLMMLTVKGLAKMMEQQHSMTLEEQREFQTVLDKANSLLEGASIGLPKDKAKA
ncbi:hypothetical protein E6H20_06815 [Candidatus Bathyarchaeota archaeon]|nr:MAG: hypothetical protein E6H20_06815 [Candidatus Bathyarchaeota archaeon]